MFTGIVETKGTLLEIVPVGGDSRLLIDCGSISITDCQPGDSIAVSGVCLTMLELDETKFCADVSCETLELTTLGMLQPGRQINLELAMTLQDRLGGHMVSGHVDGKACLRSRQADGRAQRLVFELPGNLARYVAKKGSICIDGVSLTVNEVDGFQFSVCLIPHTLEVTTLGILLEGDEVNIEVDLIARYLERLMDTDFSTNDSAGGGLARGM